MSANYGVFDGQNSFFANKNNMLILAPTTKGDISEKVGRLLDTCSGMIGATGQRERSYHDTEVNMKKMDGW